MVRVALALAAASLVAAAVPAPGLYLAIGWGLGAIGVGWVGFTRRGPGGPRLAAAAAVMLGGTALILGAIRVAIALAAISHVDKMLG
jgi:hypothetical protein